MFGQLMKKENRFKLFRIEMRILNYYFILIISLFLVSCLPKKAYRLGEDSELIPHKSKIAVLDFEYSGNFVSAMTAKLATEKLTTNLYLNRNFQVIDRSIVAKALEKYEDSKKGRYSAMEIKTLGKELQATHLVLGRLHSFGSIENTFDNQDKIIELTIRILAANSSEVIGIAEHLVKGKEDSDILVDRLVFELVDKFWNW